MDMEVPGPLAKWYRERIGTPSTGDEVIGYWIFSLGVVLGVLGLVQFFFSPSNSIARGLGYLMGAVGLLFLMIGPTIRLPLDRRATQLAYVGGALSLIALVWFVVVYPGGWDRPVGHVGVVTVYAVGLLLVAFGAVVTPMITGPRGTLEETEAAAQRAEAERDVARDAVEKAESDLEDLAEMLETLDADHDALVATVAEHAESKAAFELYEDNAGQWRWRLRHRNGNIIADGGQGYSSRQKATQGLSSVKTNAFGAAVAVQAVEEDAEGEPEVLAAESQGTFEHYEDAGGEYRWRLRHDNGEIIADSGEGYASRSNVKRAMATTERVVGSAAALDLGDGAFEVYADAGGEWRWRLLASNGLIVADAGEGFASRSNARRAVETVREVATDPENFEVYEDEAGEYRWRLVAENNEYVAESGQGYADEGGAREAVDRVTGYAESADAIPVGAAAFEIYEDAGGEWRWRLRARNGETVADSGEGYADRSKAREAVDNVKRHAVGADVEAVEA